MSQNKNTIPPSPGTVIKKYLIDGLGLSVQELSRSLKVPANRLYQILNNQRDISVDTAIRLGKYLSMPANFWLDIQTAHQIFFFKNKKNIENDIIPFESKKKHVEESNKKKSSTKTI